MQEFHTASQVEWAEPSHLRIGACVPMGNEISPIRKALFLANQLFRFGV